MKDDFAKIVKYMNSHWPSRVKEEWQVGLEEYPKIAERVVREWGKNASKGKELCRIAGLSGSGKTTQLLPAVKAYFDGRGKKPILVAARAFVEYHPHYKDILAEYGEKNLRKMTDEFATVMMFLTLKELCARGYDIILDVTLLDPMIEEILVKTLDVKGYKAWMTMVAVSPVVTEKFLGGRVWRHTKETEEEFVRATRKALEFYKQESPDMEMIMWNVWSEKPVYVGGMAEALPIFDKYTAVEDVPEHDEENLKVAKMGYFEGQR